MTSPKDGDNFFTCPGAAGDYLFLEQETHTPTTGPCLPSIQWKEDLMDTGLGIWHAAQDIHTAQYIPFDYDEVNPRTLVVQVKAQNPENFAIIRRATIKLYKAKDRPKPEYLDSIHAAAILYRGNDPITFEKYLRAILCHESFDKYEGSRLNQYVWPSPTNHNEYCNPLRIENRVNGILQNTDWGIGQNNDQWYPPQSTMYDPQPGQPVIWNSVDGKQVDYNPFYGIRLAAAVLKRAIRFEEYDQRRFGGISQDSKWWNAVVMYHRMNTAIFYSKDKYWEQIPTEVQTEQIRYLAKSTSIRGGPMSMKKTFIRFSGVSLVLSVMSLSPAICQPRVYVVSQNWFVTIVDVSALKIVDDFEIIQSPVPPLDPRTAAVSPLLVTQNELLFVGNIARALPQNYTAGCLKIMKVDLRTKLSTPYFLDPPAQGQPNLMGDGGTLYFDSGSALVYACYADRPATYAIDLNGHVQQQYTSPEGCPRQGLPRYGSKIYSLDLKRLDELDFLSLTWTTVLGGLAFVGGSPYRGGDLKFFNYTQNEATVLIADSGAVSYNVRKDLVPWIINSQTQCTFVYDGTEALDVAGYKKFVGDYLTVFDGDVTFWVFDPSRVPTISLVYKVTLPSAQQVWQGDAEAPQEPFGPAPYLVPGTNIVAAFYSGLGDWRPVKLLLVNASTGATLKQFKLHAGIAGIAFR